MFGAWGGFRLLRPVHIQLRLLAFLDRAARRSQNGGLWSWRLGFSCIWFPPVLKRRAGLFDYVGPRPASRLSADSGSAFPFSQQGQHPQTSFSELDPPAYRSLCLRFARYLTITTAKLEARMVSLFLSSRALSSPTICRFIPAHCQALLGIARSQLISCPLTLWLSFVAVLTAVAAASLPLALPD